MDKGGDRSFIFVEAIRDLHSQFTGALKTHFMPAATAVPSYEQEIGRVTVHEIAHQFGLVRGQGADVTGHRAGANIMAAGGVMTVVDDGKEYKYVPIPDDEYYFDPLDIADMRGRLKSPNTKE